MPLQARAAPRVLLALVSAALAGESPPTFATQAPTLAIHAIQGSGGRSPVEGAVVVTSGVVTGRKSNAVFVQAPDSATDADPRTSEGIFVLTGMGRPFREPGIDVGFLVDLARIEVLQVVQEGRGTQFRSPTTGQLELLNDRPPLVLRARALLPLDPRPLTVIVNHLRSLIEIESPTSGARVRSGRAHLGDGRLQRARVQRRLPRHHRHHSGCACPAHADGARHTGRARPQSGQSPRFDREARSLLLCLRRQRGDAGSDASRPERISDHDPAIIYIKVR